MNWLGNLRLWMLGRRPQLEHTVASFTKIQLPPLKVAALDFDKLVILDPAGASWATIGADHHARDAVMQLKEAGILQMVTPTEIQAKFGGPKLCVHHGHPSHGMAA